MMDAETVLERRRLRRRTSFWRVVAFVALAIALAVTLSALADLSPESARRNQIARIPINGFLSVNPASVKRIEDAAKSDAVKAIILRINSPGGAASGGEALFNAIRAAAQKKPVVAMIDGLGASGAYMAAIAADWIVTRESALVGSIGVLMQFPNIENLLNRVGVDYREVKSTPLKAEPGLFTRPPEAAFLAMQSIVDDTYVWFVNLVATRRDLEPARARALADGRIFTGRQAVGEHLVDAIGGEVQLRDWLADQKNISKDLPVLDWKGPSGSFLEIEAGIWGRLARAAGLEWLFPRLAGGHVLVDGLLMVWHAPVTIPSND